MQEVGFNERLKSERERLGLSQAYCAKLVEVSLSAWRSWERDRSMPADKLGQLVSSGFNIPFIVGMTRSDQIPADRGFAGDQVKSPPGGDLESDADHIPKAGSKKYPMSDTTEHRINEPAPAVLPDLELLRGCIGALEEDERYRRLAPDEKGSAVVALYRLSILTRKPPKEQLRGAA